MGHGTSTDNSFLFQRADYSLQNISPSNVCLHMATITDLDMDGPKVAKITISHIKVNQRRAARYEDHR
jgi:hypothetical protein